MLRADPPGGWGERARGPMEGGGGGGPTGVVRSGVFRVLVIGNRVGGLLSPLPGICNDFLIQDTRTAITSPIRAAPV